jgi:hypothetical protein
VSAFIRDGLFWFQERMRRDWWLRDLDRFDGPRQSEVRFDIGCNDIRFRVRVTIRLHTKVVQQLSCRRAGVLKKPRLVKLSMMTWFHKTQVQVQIHNILVRCGITEKDALKIVLVELTTTDAIPLDADL